MSGIRIKRGALVVGAIASVVLLVSACGGSSGNGTTGPGTGVSASPMSVDQLATAAAKEGKVVWYTTFTDTVITPLINAFNASYPDVKVQALRLSPAALLSKVAVEQRAGTFNGDVVSGSSPQVSQLLAGGNLAPYQAPDAQPLPSSLKLPAGYQGVLNLETSVIAYNPEKLQAAGLAVPTTWQDLTAPAWQGKFSMDADDTGFYECLVLSMGHDKAQALVKALGDNKPVLVTSHTLAVTQVVSGEQIATLSTYGPLAAQQQAKSPSQVTWVNPVPIPTSITMVDLLKNGPDPNAGRLFLDWLLSKDGQNAIINAGHYPSIRSDAANDPQIWNPDKWTAVYEDPTLSPSMYNTYTQEFKEALHVPLGQ